MKKFLIAKFVSLMLLGTAYAQWSPTVVHFGQAIARTEGFYVKGSLPNRLHNPGDIRTSRRDAYDGQTGVYHGYAVFKNDRAGFQALYELIQRVIDGNSEHYSQEMTMLQFAKNYAASPQWPKTLCKILKIAPTVTFESYFDLAPRIRLTGVNNDDILRTLARAYLLDVQEMPILYASVH